MNKVEDIKPYDTSRNKEQQVEEMFDAISPAYDFMNSAMSFGLHRVWRNKALKKAVALLPNLEGLKILDVATGTGDLAFYLNDKLSGAKITAIDLSAGMLEIARKKLEKLSSDKRLSMTFGKADCLALPFFESEFDMITVAYGVRNFSNLLKGLQEMHRVLKPGGVICIIELSEPQGKLTKAAYNLYSGKIIPAIGKRVSGDSRAYSYLPESIAACEQREDMAALMHRAGFTDVNWRSLTFGAVTYYIGRK